MTPPQVEGDTGAGAGVRRPRPHAPLPSGEWRRLNPRMIIVRPIHEFVRLVPALLLIVVLGQGDTQRLWWGLGAVALLLLHGVVHWWRTSYRITDEHVELHTGLVSRRRLSVRRDRIRTVETTARFGHRIFGLAEVRIGTGRHDQKQRGPLSLDAVTGAEADRLRLFLLQRTPATPTPSGSPEARTGTSALATLDPRWLRYAPLTLTGLTWVGVLVGFVFRAMNELDGDTSSFGPAHAMVHWIDVSPLAEIVLVAALLVVLIASVGSLVGYVFQFWNF